MIFPIPEIGTPVRWQVNAQDLVSSSPANNVHLSMFIDGQNSTTSAWTDSAGIATFQSPGLARGLHNVTFSSAVSTLYASATKHSSITAFQSTNLSVEAGTIIVGKANNISIRLLSGGVPVPPSVVHVDVGDQSLIDVTTDSSGRSWFIWSPSNTGSYALNAKFLGDTLGVAGFRSSSNTTIFEVVSLSTTNTQSLTGGSQSVTLNTAQGNAQSPNIPSIQVSFPSIGYVVISLNGIQKGSVQMSNEFGVNPCAVSVFGACIPAPFLRIRVAAVLAGVMDLEFTGNVFRDVALTASLQDLVPSDLTAFGLGMFASSGIGLIADLIAINMGASGLGPAISAPSVFLGMLIAAIIAVVTGWTLSPSRATRLSYLEGLILGPVLGIPGIVVGMRNVTLPYGLSADFAVWSQFWRIVQTAWILPPPISDPWSAAVMVFGFALYLVIAGVALLAASVF